MKTKKILDNLSGIDEKYINEAQLGQNQKRRSRAIRLIALAAAVMILAVSIPVGLIIANRTNKNDAPATVDTEKTLQTNGDASLPSDNGERTTLPAVVPESGQTTETNGTTDTTDTTDTTVVPPQSKLVQNGLVFAINPDLKSYSIVGVEADVEEVTEIPQTVNDLPVTEFPELLELMITRPGLITLADNIVFLNGTAYILQVVDGKIDLSDTDYIMVDNCLIDEESGTLLIAFDNPVIPDDGSVRSIASYAFCRCKSVGTLTLPESVKTISPYAFSDCLSMSGIVFKGQVEQIGKNAFWGCDNLKTVSVGSYEIWDTVVFDSLLSNPLYCGADLYVNGEPAVIDESREPDRTTDAQAWLLWLTTDRYCAGRKYNPVAACGAYMITYFDEMAHQPVGDPCAWEIWNGHFQMVYMLRDADISKECTWEVFYRKAGEGDYERVAVTPWSTYEFGAETGWMTIYRLETYAAGMTDLSTNDGEPQDYEFIFVIHESDEQSPIAAWCTDTLTVNDTYELWLSDARDAGIID